MTATGTDRMDVLAGNPQDAKDLARRRWEQEGFRMREVVGVRALEGAEGPLLRWRVEAVVEVARA